MIELIGVTKSFGRKKAVDGLDLRVRAGELFAFLGPNGAGKTTTIKMLCGLLTPSSGTVRIGGFPSSSREARQLIAYVPDQPYLYEKLTGREFLRFVVEMYGLDRRHATAKIEELIDIFEMRDYIDELCENYSHGMKQRVVFASALVHEPKVLIVDEPLVGLDPRSGRIVKDLFVSQARSGVAVLMSTHLLAIAEELADTIGIIDRGKMLMTGSLAEIRERAQMHGPLEDLFLKLTSGDRPRLSAPSASSDSESEADSESATDSHSEAIELGDRRP
jgi:ABC-2 type transport system ATP-binding protein